MNNKKIINRILLDGIRAGEEVLVSLATETGVTIKKGLVNEVRVGTEFNIVILIDYGKKTIFASWDEVLDVNKNGYDYNRQMLKQALRMFCNETLDGDLSYVDKTIIEFLG